MGDLLRQRDLVLPAYTMAPDARQVFFPDFIEFCEVSDGSNRPLVLLNADIGL